MRNHLGDKLTDELEEAYSRATGGLEGVELWKEIAADQYGGMNVFAGTREEAKMEALGVLVGALTDEQMANSQTAQATDQRTGPPQGQQTAAEQKPSGGKFSIQRTINMTLQEQLRDFDNGTMRSSDAFYFGETPTILVQGGIANNPLAMNTSDFRKSSQSKHGIPRRIMKGLNESLGHALFAFRDGDRIGVVTADLDRDGKPLLVALRERVRMDSREVNTIKSVYGLDHPAQWLVNQVSEGKAFVLFDEKGANAFLHPYGYSASREGGIRSTAASVPQQGPEVKGEFSRESSDYIQELRELQKQNETLKKRLDYWMGQTRLSGGPTVDHTAVLDEARQIIRDMGIRGMTIDETAQRLQNIYDLISTGQKDGNELSYGAVREMAEDRAYWLKLREEYYNS